MAAVEEELQLTWKRPGNDLELDLLPLQGLWTVEQYLELTSQTNHLIEFIDGRLEALPMPTRRHQDILAYLYEAFLAYIRPRGGKVLFAPLRVQIAPRRFREPDLVLLLDRDDIRNQEQYWLGADLVVEVVSPDHPQRDTREKRHDYAVAGITEYWIVNPVEETITVLTLIDDSYVEHGVYGRGNTAQSVLLDDFEVDVSAALDAR